MKNYLGFIAGFFFGLLGVIMAATGLAARTGEILAPFFTPAFFFLRNLGASGLPILFPIGILLNGLFFGLIGYLIQKYLRSKNKNEHIILYIFVAIILLFILALFLECGIIKSCMA